MFLLFKEYQPWTLQYSHSLTTSCVEWSVNVSYKIGFRFHNAKTWCLDCTLNFQIVCCGWIWTDVLQMSLSLFCRFLEYKAGPASLTMADISQQTISSFAQRVHLYAPNSSRQQAITQAILQDLVIGCSLPLSLVENPNFRHFLSVMDCKYTPVSRTNLTEKQIPYHVSKVKDYIIKVNSDSDWFRFNHEEERSQKVKKRLMCVWNTKGTKRIYFHSPDPSVLGPA